MIAEVQARFSSASDRAANIGASLRTVAEFFGRRLQLVRSSAPEHARAPRAGLLLGELGAFAEPVARYFRPPLVLEKAEHPRVVILLPGFASHPLRMRYMARTLESAGHTVKRWGMGYNLGPSEVTFDVLSRRILDVHQRFGEKVVLVGWSLGGVFARELAKRRPNCVDKVITLGSPFSHTPYSNNVWRLYQMITGHSVESPPVDARTWEKPPVETVAFWSPRDGVIDPHSARGLPGERDKAIALRCTHMGFSNSAESIKAVARELSPS